MFVLCCNNGHWTLVFKLNENYYYIDTKGEEIKNNEDVILLNEYINIMNEKENKPKNDFIQLKVEYQVDNYSCGYRVLLYIFFICYMELNPNKLIEKLQQIKFDEDTINIIEECRIDFLKLEHERFEECSEIKQKSQKSKGELISNEQSFINKLKTVLMEIVTSFQKYLN